VRHSPHAPICPTVESLSRDLRFLQERTASVVESIRIFARPDSSHHRARLASWPRAFRHCAELERNAGFAIHVEAEVDCDTGAGRRVLCL
jgi:hypothetical protein